MSENEQLPGKRVSLDPLNPPVGIETILIIETIHPDTGAPIIDVQGGLLKDLRNKDYTLNLMRMATVIVEKWFDQNIEFRRLKSEIDIDNAT